VPPPAPLFRLSQVEYESTVLALLGLPAGSAGALPVEPDESLTTTLPGTAVDGYHALAHDLALRATADAASLQALTGCDPTADSEACRTSFMASFLARALRRTPTTEDLTDFEGVFARGEELGGDFASGARAVVEVALQAPEFLYRIELGEPLTEPPEPRMAGWSRPTPFEMAARLSYLLWDSMPDQALLDGAAQGGLRTKDEVLAEATRLLADAKSRPVVRRFHQNELLRIDPRHSSDPRISPEVAALLLEETGRFVESVTFDGPGDLASLFTSPHSFMNGPLAAFYGIDGVSGESFQRVDLDPGRRGGLLTQAAFLASAVRPTVRGIRVFTRVLCGEVPSAPADIPVLPPADATGTTRDRLLSATADPGCAGCHRLVDPIGFAFENYDAAGLWRDTEYGLPIDASGTITTTDVAGDFLGAVELSERLARSEDVKRCYVGHWMTFAYGPSATGGDACSRQQLERAFERGNVQELVLALTQADSFLYRPAEEQP
jgi:hypothetical protein